VKSGFSSPGLTDCSEWINMVLFVSNVRGPWDCSPKGLFLLLSSG
jgi:hypothetical protein